MAGHSKWANIQHRKKAQDAKRGKVFTRLIREITVSARMGGSDPDSNPRLRAAIDAAKTANMPNDTINRAIAKGAGELGDGYLEEVRYEGYGPCGVAIIVDCVTDNKNRTVAEVRHAFSKKGGNLGTDGSVAYLFNKLGQFIFAPGASEDKIMEIALEAGAQDVQSQEDNSIEVVCSEEDFSNLKESFMRKALIADIVQLTMLPSTVVSLDGENAEKVMALLDMLDNLDDVQNVYSNADFE